MQEDQLLDLIRHSSSLKHLTLCHFYLHHGLWENVIGKIRSALQLKTVMLHILFNGIPDIKNYCENDHHMIEDFFLRNGENPYTDVARKRWTAKSYGTRQSTNNDLSCEERYKMFH